MFREAMIKGREEIIGTPIHENRTTNIFSFRFRVIFSSLLLEKNNNPPMKQQNTPLIVKHK
jgi:hypothetical protein